MADKLGYIQISQDGYSKVSFAIDNEKLQKNIENVSISMVIEIEGETEEFFESRTGLDLYAFKQEEVHYVGRRAQSSGSTETFGLETLSDVSKVEEIARATDDFVAGESRAYLVEDYFVEISKTNPKSAAYYADGVVTLDVFKPLAVGSDDKVLYNLLPFAKYVKKAKFVFVYHNRQTDYITEIKYLDNFSISTVDYPFISTPVVIRVGNVTDNKINTNRYFGFSKSEKETLEQEFEDLEYGIYDPNISGFRVSQDKSNQIVIISKYNENIPKSKYKVYINGKLHPVSKRVVGKEKDVMAYIINLKPEYADENGNYSPVISIEEDYVSVSSTDIRNAVVSIPDDPDDEDGEGVFVVPATGIILEYPELEIEDSPSITSETTNIKSEEGEVVLIATPSDLGSDPAADTNIGNPSAILIKANSEEVEILDPESINIDASSGINLPDVEGVYVSNPESVSVQNPENIYLPDPGNIYIPDPGNVLIPESDPIFAIERVTTEDPCEKPLLSKISAALKNIKFKDENGEPLSTKKSSSLTNIFSSKGSNSGFTGILLPGQKISSNRTKKISTMDGKVKRKIFSSLIVDRNRFSHVPKIISINGDPDISSKTPSEIETIETTGQPPSSMKIAINDITIQPSNISTGGVTSVEISKPTDLTIQGATNILLPCESKLSLVIPSKILDDVQPDPEIEDPCDKNKRERGVFPEIPGWAPPLDFFSVTLKDVAEKIASVQSVCDFSFYLTAELSVQLRGFENVLKVIKIIFCIVDVLCSIQNPIKFFKALIRLFNCLWDLIALLPQFAIPIMMLKLVVHILELLKCVFDKIAYYVIGLTEIYDRAVVVVSNTDLQSVYKLEKTLEKYLFSFKAEIDVLRPIEDVMNIFRRMLDLVFNLPCNLGVDIQSDNIFCIENIAASAIIAQKAQSYENLLMVAQTYTTESPGDCGNTPPFKDLDSLNDLRRSGKVKIGSKGCEGNWDVSDSKVLMFPEANSGYKISDLSSSKVAENIDLLSMRVKNGSFEGTFKISATKIVKSSINIKSLVNVEKDETRVYISFGNNLDIFGNPKDDVSAKGITSERVFGKFRFGSPKNISENDTVDDSVSLLEVNNGGIFVGNQNSSSMYSAFGNDRITLEGSKQEGMHPSPLIYSYEGNNVTYPNTPSFLIVDDEGDVYSIEKNGIKFDSDGKIKGIFANIISDTHGVRKTFQKEDETVIVNQGILDAQANFEVVKQILFEENIVFSNTAHGRKVMSNQNYASFIRAKENLQITVAEIEGRLVNPLAGAYDFLGGSDDDIQEYQESVDLVEVYKFVDIFFVDVRSAGSELIESCGSQVQTLENLEAPTTDEVLETVNSMDDCIKAVKNYVYSGIEDITSQFEKGVFTKNPFAIEDVYSQYKKAEDCANSNLGIICNQAISSFSSSFKISEDTSKNSVDGAIDPSNVPDQENYFGAALTKEEFDVISSQGVSFTGASEYASGIGDYIESSLDKPVEITVILRDIYDKEIGIDFSEKIEIKIEEDSTGSASVGAVVAGDTPGTSIATITARDPGTVKISASVCGKSIKAFTIDSLNTEFSDESCTSTSTQSLVSELAVGSIATMKRVLTISFVDQGDEYNKYVQETSFASQALKTGQEY